MKRSLALAGALLVTVAAPAAAHRLDEYLQATTLLVSKNRVLVEMRLAPGVAVAGTVIASIDVNHDGAISDAEREKYGQQVLSDLSLTLDGEQVSLRLLSDRFATVDELKEGLGEIGFVFEGDLREGASERKLVLENRHRRAIAAYLVNSLVPEEPDIRIISQHRNPPQSVYEMRYEQTAASTRSVSFDALLRWTLALGAIAVVLRDRVSWWRRRAAA